jgi:uncharacterized protein YndB with AHSA1/START domain
MSTKLPVHATATALFSASAERVFDAFLDTKTIGQFMFGPGVRDEEIVSLTNEPRVGGSFSYIVRRGGQELDHIGEYVEIKRPHHLVFTWSVKQDTTADKSRVIIDIASIIDGCELTLTHEMPKGWEDFVGKDKVAWGKTLDKLTEILSE